MVARLRWRLGMLGSSIPRSTGPMSEIIHKEIDLTMAFCSHAYIGTVDRSNLVPGTYPA
jgi:hypothetical protein